MKQRYAANFGSDYSFDSTELGMGQPTFWTLGSGFWILDSVERVEIMMPMHMCTSAQLLKILAIQGGHIIVKIPQTPASSLLLLECLAFEGFAVVWLLAVLMLAEARFSHAQGTRASIGPRCFLAASISIFYFEYADTSSTIARVGTT